MMACAGRHGPEVRSDCWINVEPGGSGLHLNLESKVKSLYGTHIERQIKQACARVGLKNARIDIKDSGALPFVISARLETALRRSGINVGSTLVPPAKADFTASDKDRLRRTRLYLPGNTPHLFLNAGLHEPDAIILDLEDSVAPSEKDAARVLVRNALLAVDFYKAERMVRINQLPMGLDDLEWIVPCGVQLILLPKCESPDQARLVDEKLNAINPGHAVWLLPIIESARGCFYAFEIAGASPNIAGLAVGLEDYTADIGVQRTSSGYESLWAQSRIVNAARAHGIQAIGSVFSHVDDQEGCFQAARAAKNLGFDGMGCIHPRHIPVMHDAFAPGEDEISRAKEIVLAFAEAQEKGLGVVSLNNKMIDAPVVKRAQTVIRHAIQAGRLNPGWQDNTSEVE
ncbi:HpcH/HpaI aldolase/citrate lyase family protein [candidate division KSB1 bacterium]|nr:HpcH/HpaI aldolase/citrate lyase family protein [candidate division KSB1 bacterium]